MSSDATKNPTGGVADRRVMEDRPLDPVTVENVVKRDNMLSAWKQVNANCGAGAEDWVEQEKLLASCKDIVNEYGVVQCVF